MKEVIKKPVISIDGVDLTNAISQVTIDLPDDEVDVTGFGTDYKETDQGLKDASISLDMFQDFAAARVDATLWPLKANSEAFLTNIRPKEGEAAEDNPVFQMAGKLFNYNPLSASVGEASTTSPTIKNVTQLGVLRSTKKGTEEEAGSEAKHKKELEDAIA